MDLQKCVIRENLHIPARAEQNFAEPALWASGDCSCPVSSVPRAARYVRLSHGDLISAPVVFPEVLSVSCRHFLLATCFPEQTRGSPFALPKPDHGGVARDEDSPTVYGRTNCHPALGEDFRIGGHIQWYKNRGLNACHHHHSELGTVQRERQRGRRGIHWACFRITLLS